MLHTKYQGSMTSGSRQEGFYYVLPIYAYFIDVTPTQGIF